MDNKQLIKITDANGVEKEVEVITYFTLHSNNRKYLIYTENIEDQEGNVEIYTSEVIDKPDGSIELAGIDDEAVWNEIQLVMNDLIKEGE